MSYVKLKVGVLLTLALAVAPLSAQAEPVQQLEPLVVTATRTELPVERVPASITVITGEEIQAMQAHSLKDVLLDAVGVAVIDRGTAGSVSTLSIRGSEAGQVLVLLDGVRLNSAQNGLFSLSDLPVALEQIERIEVLRGTASSLYGPNALAGVVHIITKRARQPLASQVQVTAGRDDALGGSAALSGRSGAVDFRLGAAVESSDGYRENSELLAQRFDGQLGVALSEAHRLELQAFVLDKRSGSPGSTAFPSAVDTLYDDNLSLSARLLSSLGEAQLTTRVGYDRQLSRFDDLDFWMGPKVSRHELQTGSFETQWERVFGRHQLVVGGDYYYDDLDSTDNGQRHQQRGSLFAMYQVEPVDNLDINLALRRDEHSEFAGQWSPRLGAAYRFADGTRLRAGAGKAYKAPTLNDRFWPNDGFSVGNPDLTPEEAWEYEVGVDRPFGDTAHLALAAFQRDVDDLIEWEEVSPFFWTPSNIGRARIRGVEAEGSWKVTQRLRVGANYTYLQPKDRADDSYLQDRARHEAMAFVDVELLADLFLRLTGRYYDLYHDPNRLQDTFTIYDIGLRYRFTAGERTTGQVALGVKNLFDEEYELKTGFPMPPVSPYLTLSLQF